MGLTVKSYDDIIQAIRNLTVQKIIKIRIKNLNPKILASFFSFPKAENHSNYDSYDFKL